MNQSIDEFNNCITYHVLQCVNQGVSRQEFLDTFNVALVVGGSITSPTCARHLNGWMKCWQGRMRDLVGSQPLPTGSFNSMPLI